MRDYPDLLVDIEYENKMKVSEFLLMNEKLYEGYEAYKYNKNIKRRQPLLTEHFGEKSLFWRDDENGVLGVANDKFSQIFPLKDIEDINIERILPAKGAGRDDIKIKMKGKDYYDFVFYADCYTFDSIIEKLQNLIGREVKIMGFYYDC